MSSTIHGYNSVWPEKIAPWILILSGFAGLVVISLVFRGWFSFLNCICGSGTFQKIKVERIDLTIVADEEEDSRRRSSLARVEHDFERDFDRDEQQLQTNIHLGQQDAHERLMERLRRSSVRVTSKNNMKVHPLTRRRTDTDMDVEDRSNTEDNRRESTSSTVILDSDEEEELDEKEGEI